MTGRHMGIPGSTPEGLLLAECWCRLTVVAVDPAEVREGRTGTCGQPACHPPEEAA